MTKLDRSNCIFNRHAFNFNLAECRKQAKNLEKLALKQDEDIREYDNDFRVKHSYSRYVKAEIGLCRYSLRAYRFISKATDELLNLEWYIGAYGVPPECAAAMA